MSTSAGMGVGKYQVTPKTLGGGEVQELLLDATGRLITTTGTPSGTGSAAKTEDTVHASGDTGQFVLGVINTAGTAFAANGDYAAIGISADGGVYTGSYSKTRVTADALVKTGVGAIHTVTIAPTTATPTAGLLTIYDNTTETGTIIYSEWIFATTIGHTITLDAVLTTGIYVGYDATLANVSCTVTYR